MTTRNASGSCTAGFTSCWSLEREVLQLGTSMSLGKTVRILRYNPTTTFETFPFPAGLAPNVPVTNYTADPRATAVAEGRPAARRIA